jgi:hypothetical protein
MYKNVALNRSLRNSKIGKAVSGYRKELLKSVMERKRTIRTVRRRKRK